MASPSPDHPPQPTPTAQPTQPTHPTPTTQPTQPTHPTPTTQPTQPTHPTRPGPIDAGADGGGDYDPHLHRVVEAPTTNFETLIHLVKCSVGTGILAMPQAFTNAGLVTGAVSTLIIGVMITHCLHMLIEAQYALCKWKRVPLLTYRESMIATFEIGPNFLKKLDTCAGILVDVFLVVYQLGICCVYTLFIAKILKQMVDPYYSMPVELCMLIILAPIICANLIRNLKVLAPFSTVANVLTMLGLVLVTFYLLSNEKKSKNPLDLWGSPATFPLFFGTTLFALTAVGVVVALENNMKTPKDFLKPFGVLNIGMGFVTVLYVAVGVVGYLFCVEQCSDAITLDMDSDSWITKSVLILYAVAIAISYVLQCYVPVEILWKTYILPRLMTKGCGKLLLWEYGLRIMLCIITFVLAVLVPRLGLFISLFGALCLSALGMIFPSMMKTLVIKPNYGKLKWILGKNIVLFIVGLFGMVVGTITTIIAIIKSFQ